MKKRLLSILLIVCMVTALFSALTVNAYADVDISADTVKGYAVAYKVQSGDAMYKICNSLGVNYNNAQVQADIAKWNPGASVNRLTVGQVVYIPVASVGSASVYYTLYAHVAASGDTYNKIAQAYGTKDSTALFKSFNTTTKTLYVGNTVLIPVLTGNPANLSGGTAVSAPASGAGAAGNTGTGSSTPASGAGAAGNTGTGTGTGTGTDTGSTTTHTSAATATQDGVMGYLVQYTMKSGDTLRKVCGTLGTNYYTYSNAITKINGLSNPNSVKAGTTLWLPSASVADTSKDYYTLNTHVIVKGDTVGRIAQKYGTNASNPWIGYLNTISLSPIYPGNVIIIPQKNGKIVTTTTTTDGTGTSTSTTTTTGGSTSGTGTGTSTSTSTADTVAYYLIQHTMKKGETVNGICNSLGIKFSTYGNMIKQINNIKSWTSMSIGTVILIPSKSKPADGKGYEVIAHTAVAGDTVSKLCTKYGIKYGSYVNMLKALNNNINLNSIRVGQVLFFPAPIGTCTGSSASGAGAAGNTGTGTSTPASGAGASGNTGTGVTTTSTKTGTVSSASYAEGTKITLNISKIEGYEITSVTVTAGNTSIPVTDNGDGTYQFVMPATDVTYTVVFTKTT